MKQREQEVRLAIVGAGLVGKRHIDAIRNVRGVELVAIADTAPGPELDALKEQSDVSVVNNIAQVLDIVDMDGVVIATPTLLHVQQGLDCVKADLPMLIEKPLASSSSDAWKLVKAADGANVPILVGHHRRYNPLIRKAYQIVNEGQLGKLRTVHINCWFYKPDNYFSVAPWRTQAGAGPVSVNLVHDIDLIRYLCGEIIEVQARSAPSVRGYANEDVAAALLHFENGVIGTVSVSDSVVSPWSWELTSREYPIYPATDQSCYLIGGDCASLSIPDLRVWSHEEQPDWWSPITATSQLRESTDPLISQIEHFAEVIRGEEEPLVSGLEGYRTLQVIEAIQQSAKQKCSITIESIDSA